jgi:enoyl-CoA hydratase/carnithine racemase
MDESMLLATDDHGVATLTMNRPDKLNAFDVPMI